MGLAFTVGFALLPSTVVEVQYNLSRRLGLGSQDDLCLPLLHRTVLLYQGWVVDAIEVLMIAFVLEDVAETFGLDSVSKGLIGSASFFGESAAGDKRVRVCRIFSLSTAQRT